MRARREQTTRNKSDSGICRLVWHLRLRHNRVYETYSLLTGSTQVVQWWCSTGFKSTVGAPHTLSALREYSIGALEHLQTLAKPRNVRLQRFVDGSVNSRRQIEYSQIGAGSTCEPSKPKELRCYSIADYGALKWPLWNIRTAKNPSSERQTRTRLWLIPFKKTHPCIREYPTATLSSSPITAHR